MVGGRFRSEAGGRRWRPDVSVFAAAEGSAIATGRHGSRRDPGGTRVPQGRREAAPGCRVQTYDVMAGEGSGAASGMVVH